MFLLFQAEDGIRDYKVTGVQTCALPISGSTIAWSTSDTTIVVVSPTGEARAVRDGAATLTASLGQLSGTAAITVTAPRVQGDAGARASARIGPDGGTVFQTAGGKRYLLLIPWRGCGRLNWLFI